MIAENNDRLKEIIIKEITDLFNSVDSFRGFVSMKTTFKNDIRNWTFDYIDDDQVTIYNADVEFNEMGRLQTATIEIDCKYY